MPDLVLQLFHALLQCMSILTQQRDGLHVTALVLNQSKILIRA
jgi:hypothetical protein